MFKLDKFQETMLEQLDKLTDKWQTVYSFRDYSNAFNLETGKQYNGLNALLLTFLGMTQGFQSVNGWATFNQIKSMKGNLKKGSKGAPVTTKPILFNKTDADGNPILDEEGNPQVGQYFKHFIVFKAEDIEGIDFSKYDNNKCKVEHSEQDRALFDRVIRKAEEKGIKIVSDRQDVACYRPNFDEVNVPSIEWLKDNGYATLCHELIHATGHQARLNRPKGNAFGSDEYAYEELIAEIGSIICCQHLRQDFQFDKNSIAYIKGWLNKCHKDKKDKLIIKAINQSLEAVKWLFDDFEFTLEQEL